MRVLHNIKIAHCTTGKQGFHPAVRLRRYCSYPAGSLVTKMMVAAFRTRSFTSLRHTDIQHCRDAIHRVRDVSANLQRRCRGKQGFRPAVRLHRYYLYITSNLRIILAPTGTCRRAEVLLSRCTDIQKNPGGGEAFGIERGRLPTFPLSQYHRRGKV